MTNLVVAGALANKTGQGGEAWVRLSWVRGLQRLGFHVTFIEQVAAACADDTSVRYFAQTLDAFDVDGALVTESGTVLAARGGDDVVACLDDAGALIDISGNVRSKALRGRARRSVYVDIDPGFTQFWTLEGHLGEQLAGYDDHVTIAENIGRPDCAIPTAGLSWHTVRQPVVLDDWPAMTGTFDRFTTIATWRSGFGRVTHDGKTFGLKLDEFRKVADLPALSGLPFELALNIHPAEVDDLRMLDKNGWTRVEAQDVSHTADDFRRYVQGSGAEFSVAQGIYVETNSGWFSDRTVRYLASARPVLVQDTGFSRSLPVGDGLLTFRDRKDAAAAAQDVVARYAEHAEAARAVAESCFGSDVVLGRFCEQLGLAP